MANKHDISLTLVQMSDGPQWEMTYGGKKYSPDGYPRIDLPYDSKAHDFEFTIVNSGSVTFKDGIGEDSPIYIMEVQDPGQKPSVGVINHQIEIIKLTKGNTVLSFKDKNKGTPRMLSYQLNFNGAPPLDPIIKNGGGTGGFVRSLLLPAIAGVALLGLAYLAYEAFFDH